MKFSSRHAARARAMTLKGVDSSSVADAFNGKYTATEIEWLIAEMRRRNQDYRAANFVKLVLTSDVQADNRPDIPIDVIAKREHRVMLRPRTTTALLCGDPLPGESALDRRCV